MKEDRIMLFRVQLSLVVLSSVLTRYVSTFSVHAFPTTTKIIIHPTTKFTNPRGLPKILTRARTFSIPFQPFTTRLYEICNNDHHTSHDDNAEGKKKSIGDPLRAATGIRPSLHPTTINALATALKQNAAAGNKKNDDEKKSLTVSAGTVSALDVAVRAGAIAADAMAQRQSSSKEDGMELSQEEQQTIAGRVVGVVMRLEELETSLQRRVEATPWIAKFGDWDSFGVVASEITGDNNAKQEVNDRLKMDPLFAMTRAECLLALFIANVETPQMAQAGQSVPDEGRQLDFLDADRQEVLLSIKE